MVVTPKKRLKTKRNRLSKRVTCTSDKPKHTSKELRHGHLNNSKTFVARRESGNHFEDYMLITDPNNTMHMEKHEVLTVRKSSMDYPKPKVLKASLLKVNKNVYYEMSLTKELKNIINYKMYKDVVNAHAFKYNKENFDKVIYIDYRNVFFENREKNSFRQNDKGKDKYDIKTNNIRILTFIFILILIIGVICTFLLIYA
jgi:hypothetical protein